MTDLTAWVEKNKTRWSRVYDEVIAPDFEQEWKSRNEKHEKELKEKEQNQQILFSHLNDEIVAKAHLTIENERLKEELRHRSGSDAPSSSLTTTNARTIPEEAFQHLTDKYTELSKKYQDLSRKAKYLEKKNALVMQKNKDMKVSVRAWQVYADRQSGKQKQPRAEDGGLRLLEDEKAHTPVGPKSAANIRTPNVLADPENSSPAALSHPPQPITEAVTRPATPGSYNGQDFDASSTSVTPRVSVEAVPAEQQVLDVNDFQRVSSSRNRNMPLIDEQRPLFNARLCAPSSSQTTVDEIAEQTTRNAQVADAGDDDDLPQFVSERNLKRKRDRQSKSRFEIYADRHSDGTPVKPFHVKEEPDSSPPMTASKLARTETFDLDEPMPNILQTPHHRRRTPLTLSNSTGTLRHQRSNSVPFTQGTKKENTETTLLDFGSGLGDIQDPSTEVRALSEPSDPTLVDVAALQPIEPNTMRNASGEPPNKRLRRFDIRRKEKYGVLAESSENVPPLDENDLRLPPHLARAQLNRRLLASRSPQQNDRMQDILKAAAVKTEREQLHTPPASASRSTRTPTSSAAQRNPMSKSFSKSREDLTPSGAVWTLKAAETRSRAQKPRLSPKKQGSLKNRPWTELTLQDFKPNPAYNQGYTYAFSETVRKRADRLCLPGCTNLQCCGSTFRTFAEAQAPLSVSQEEALLEDYLGDAYENMPLTQMSTEERKELVLQARTKKMAKESGKHREAYERRKTPPGFWRVDFPTTQEQKEDRVKAKEQERTEVQQRWLEAQRKGGKWIFRDE